MLLAPLSLLSMGAPQPESSKTHVAATPGAGKLTFKERAAEMASRYMKCEIYFMHQTIYIRYVLLFVSHTERARSPPVLEQLPNENWQTPK